MVELGFNQKQDQALEAIASGNYENVHHQTMKALKRRNAVDGDGNLTDIGRSRLENLDKPRPVRYSTFYNYTPFTPTYDHGQANAEFWDKTARGKSSGLEVSGLFIKPIASKKAAWMLGDIPDIETGDEYTDEVAQKWLKQIYGEVILAVEDAAKFGDMYLVFNADETITPVPPHVAEPIVADDDYSQVEGWRFEQVYVHPSNSANRTTVVDEFTFGRRVRTVLKNGQVQKRDVWDSFIGIPVVHIANNPDANSRFGHPEAEALIDAMHKYGSILDAAINGNIIHGRPTPVFERMGSKQNVDNFFERFGRERTAVNAQGETEEYLELDFTSDDVMILGDTGTFKYAAPGNFTQDTDTLLRILFYLIVEHSELPEFVFGNAIRGSRASAEVQFPPFVKWIVKEQMKIRWLKQLIMIYLNFKSLSDPNINVEDDVYIKWKPITAPNPAIVSDSSHMDNISRPNARPKNEPEQENNVFDEFLEGLSA